MSRTDTTLDDPPAAARPQRVVATLRALFSVDRVLETPAQELAEGETVIGRDAGPGGVLLDDPRVSRRHASVRVRAADRTARIEDSSRRGTEVDGTTVERHADLRDGSVLAMGQTLLLFRWELRPLPAPAPPVPGLLGAAPSMRAVRERIALAARGDVPVTLLGETGTGKEVVARAIHEASERRTGAFIAVNCAAIPEALAESQLFGHVPGAFTGARTPVEGFFRAADGGTLFLDEVGELSAAVQAKLLRALESGAVAPVGSARELPHRARIVTATHRDLAADVAEGRFRGDLYARITDVVVPLPSLRERPEDVLPLFRHAFGAAMPPLAYELARALVLHPWPFNVRELVRLAAQVRLAAGASSGPLGLERVAESLARTHAIAAPRSLPPTAVIATPSASGAPSSITPPDGPPDRESLVSLLRQHHGVVADVARATGRSRKQVYRWIDEHGLDPDAFRGEPG